MKWNSWTIYCVILHSQKAQAFCSFWNCGVDYRFSENFDGVVLAYDFQIQDKIAKILPGFHPYFAVRLKAKLLLFAPKPNMLLGSFALQCPI